jgi:hypothetical protein
MKDVMIKNEKQEGPTKWVKQTVMMMMMMMMTTTDVMIAFAMKTMNTVFHASYISVVCLV